MMYKKTDGQTDRQTEQLMINGEQKIDGIR